MVVKTIEDRLKCFGKRVYEAAIPCALLMVQGKVFALTPKHILIALKTGVVTGAFATLLTFMPFLKGQLPLIDDWFLRYLNVQ